MTATPTSEIWNATRWLLTISLHSLRNCIIYSQWSLNLSTATRDAARERFNELSLSVQQLVNAELFTIF